MKNLFGLIAALSFMAGIVLILMGLNSSPHNFHILSLTISGAILFGSSLIGLIILVKDSKR